MGKITSYGYERKSLPDILTSLRNKVKSKLGNSWDVRTGSVTDQFLSVFALELDEVEQGLEGVVATQTLNGAEGIYLDNILNQQGVYRKGLSAGGGDTVVFTSYANANTTIPTTTIFNATNSIQYKPITNITVDKYMGCYQLKESDIVVGTTYVFKAYNSSASSFAPTLSVTASSVADKVRVMNELVTYFNNNILDKPADCYYDVSNKELFVGFKQLDNTPLPFQDNNLFLEVSPSVGVVGTVVPVIASTKGFYPLKANNITSINPTYTGYVGVTNPNDFDSGTTTQTDAEFRSQAASIKNANLSGTLDSVLDGLSDLRGVTAVRIYSNPEFTRLKDYQNTTICDPYTYNCVVEGGRDVDIGEVIVKKAPFNTKSFGSDSVTVYDSNNNAITVKYSKCYSFDYTVKVSYKTKDNSVLLESERNIINTNLRNITLQMQIGEPVSVDWIKAVVYQSLPIGRLVSVSVELLDLTRPSTFTPFDLLVEYNKRPRIHLAGITYVRT